MIKFYRTKDGKIVSVRGRQYCDGKNFYCLHPEHSGSRDFLKEEIEQPPDVLVQSHMAQWRLYSEPKPDKQVHQVGGKPPFSAS